MKTGPGLNVNGQKSLSDTGIGNPSKATPEKGERCFNEVINKISNLIIELSKADINNMYE